MENLTFEEIKALPRAEGDFSFETSRFRNRDSHANFTANELYLQVLGNGQLRVIGHSEIPQWSSALLLYFPAGTEAGVHEIGPRKVEGVYTVQEFGVGERYTLISGSIDLDNNPTAKNCKSSHFEAIAQLEGGTRRLALSFGRFEVNA
ncbi:hypothetical protein [Pseudomonas sp. GM25]|uniref:hypothetical protein n=1 Tax=Pseudomonas sp. GM25 TaxID=1144327 RepID=UPI0012F9982F|nr:hypothetical protein [Pseudomonas sp. GM25]